MLINEKVSLTNKSTNVKTTLGQTSLSSYDAYNSKLKKRKLIVLGKMGVGKSSLLKRFVDNSLPEKASRTNEEVLNKNYFYKNEEVKLVMIDTAGQSEFTPALPSRFCVGVHGYILTFAIDDNHSFEVIQHVNRILLESIGAKYIPRILVGNKKDLDAHREVSEERIRKLAKSLKCPYIECSALQPGADVEKIFYKLLKEVDKETNDEYPYDIKNSTIKMNFIRKNHKTFNLVLQSCGLFLLFYSTVLAYTVGTLFNLFIILNLVLAVLLSLNAFRGLRIVRKQIHSAMPGINLYLYCSSTLTLLLFILLFVNNNDKVTPTFNSFNPTGMYVCLLFFQVWSVLIIRSLEPLYKEFHSTISINQQLLIKI